MNVIESLSDEIWKDVVGFEGLYQVSNLARIKVVGKEYIMIQNNDKPNFMGYNLVTLKKNNTRKTIRVHRLVAIAFIPNPENKPQVNHINAIKTDNRVENLEWATASENSIHATKLGLNPLAKLSHIEVLEARRIFNEVKITKVKLSEMFGLTPAGMGYVINKKLHE